LRWLEHVKKMDAHGLPTKVSHCDIGGKRNSDRQPKTWTENIKEDLKARNVDIMAAAELTRY